MTMISHIFSMKSRMSARCFDVGALVFHAVEALLYDGADFNVWRQLFGLLLSPHARPFALFPLYTTSLSGKQLQLGGEPS